MPPSDRKLSVPQSRDRTGLQLLWSWLLRPPTRFRMWEVQKSPAKFWLILSTQTESITIRYLPAFLRCKCNPIGSSSVGCHPATGQCVCRAGVEGRLCDTCRVGFFGFSSRGCRGIAGPYFSASHLHYVPSSIPPIHLLIHISNCANVYLCSSARLLVIPSCMSSPSL